MKRKIWLCLVLGIYSLTILGGCAKTKENKKEISDQNTEKTKKNENKQELNPIFHESQETKEIMKQVAQKDIQNDYAKFLIDKPFAAASVFDLEKNGNKRKAYVWLQTGEYVIFKDKAYRMSGGAGYAIVEYTKTGENVKLDRYIWAEDGDTGKWMKKNFSKKAAETVENDFKLDEITNKKILIMIDGKAEAELNVPVENDNILEIDRESGTYELTKIIEEGKPEDDNDIFETQVIDKGKLEKIKK